MFDSVLGPIFSKCGFVVELVC